MAYGGGGEGVGVSRVGNLAALVVGEGFKEVFMFDGRTSSDTFGNDFQILLIEKSEVRFGC